MAKYPTQKLYRATADHSSTDPLELRLCLGDLVGVIQQKDPMGHDNRWYVDNGGKVRSCAFFIVEL